MPHTSALATRPAKTLAAIQSCYIPWKGFFDLLNRCDEYVILDGAQYVKRHWHNRNKIKTANGLQWLTIPVVTKSRYEQPIDEVEISEPDWADQHWRSIEQAYRKAPHFATYGPKVRQLYEAVAKEKLLTQVNERFLRELSALLGLQVRITRDSDYAPQGKRSERLVDVCRLAHASRYVSGPSSKEYLEENLFTDIGTSVEWMSYGPYPTYPQLHGEFEHAVSVLDLLFMTGDQAPQYCLSRAADAPTP